MTRDNSVNGANRIRETGSTRRQFLAVAGSSLVGLSAVSTAQQTPQPTQSFRFGGRVQAWQARAPQSISGQQNPTLQLQAGQLYEVTWENLDGQPHNFALQDSNGQNLSVILPNVQTNMGGGGGGGGGGGDGNGGGGGGGDQTVSPPQDALNVTKTISQQGATQTLQFVATPDVAQYICVIHPTTMVGQVNIQGGGSGGGSGNGSVGNGDGSGN